MRNYYALEARLRRYERQVRRRQIPPLVLIDVTAWPDEARAAYAAGTEEERIALETQYGGPAPEYQGRDDLAVTVIVVTELPDDPATDDDDERTPRLDPAMIEARNRSLAAQVAAVVDVDKLEAQRQERERYLATLKGHRR